MFDKLFESVKEVCVKESEEVDTGTKQHIKSLFKSGLGKENMNEASGRKIGGVFFFGDGYYEGEAEKTIGEPIVGPDMEKRVQNRRNVKGKLTPKGQKFLEGVKEHFKTMYGLDVKFVWCVYCGCSMCPCSPGYNIKTVSNIELPRLKEDDRFDVYVEDDELDIREPKNKSILSFFSKKNTTSNNESKKIKEEKDVALKIDNDMDEGKVKESVDVMENLECPKCKAPLHLVNDVLYTGSRYDESKKIKEEKEDVFIDDYMQSRNYNHKLYDKLLSKLKVIHNQHKDQFPGLTFTIGMSAKYQTPYLLIKTDDKDYGKIGDIEGQIMDAIDDVGFSVGDIEEKSWGYEIKFSD
jgi:hypothetical protein